MIEDQPQLILEIEVRVEDEDDREKVSECLIRFTLPQNYPEEVPEIETDDAALLEALQNGKSYDYAQCSFSWLDPAE